MNIEEDN